MKADDKVNRIVGENMQRRRVELEMSRVALSEKTGVDDSYLGKMERGERGTSPGNYDKIARALGCTVADLFTPPSSRRRVPAVTPHA